MENRKTRRTRGRSALGNFNPSKAIAEETISDRRARKTARLRELRLARKPGSEDVVIPKYSPE